MCAQSGRRGNDMQTCAFGGVYLHPLYFGHFKSFAFVGDFIYSDILGPC